MKKPDSTDPSSSLVIPAYALRLFLTDEGDGKPLRNIAVRFESHGNGDPVVLGVLKSDANGYVSFKTQAQLPPDHTELVAVLADAPNLSHAVPIKKIAAGNDTHVWAIPAGKVSESSLVIPFTTVPDIRDIHLSPSSIGAGPIGGSNLEPCRQLTPNTLETWMYKVYKFQADQLCELKRCDCDHPPHPAPPVYYTSGLAFEYDVRW